MIIEQLLLNGFAMGCIYAIVGLGFIQVFNALGVVNFAQGEFVMLGAYFAVTVIKLARLPQVLGVLAVILAMAVVGLVFTRLIYYPLRQASLLAVILGTVGVSMVLQDSAVLIWGPVPIFLPRFFGDDVLHIGHLNIVPQHLLIIGITALLLVLEYVIFNATSIGRMMRATAQDKDAAALVGIKVPVMIALTFINSSALAGVAGAMVGPLFSVTPGMGFGAMLKGFIGCAVGGWGSIPGTVAGGIIVGLVEILGAAYISTDYRDAFVYGLLIFFLLFRPQGIFGEIVSEKV